MRVEWVKSRLLDKVYDLLTEGDRGYHGSDSRLAKAVYNVISLNNNQSEKIMPSLGGCSKDKGLLVKQFNRYCAYDKIESLLSNITGAFDINVSLGDIVYVIDITNIPGLGKVEETTYFILFRDYVDKHILDIKTVWDRDSELVFEFGLIRGQNVYS